MSPARWLEWFALVPALVRVLRECRHDSPAQRAQSIEARIESAAIRAHRLRRARMQRKAPR